MVSFRLDEAYLIGSWCSAALWGKLPVYPLLPLYYSRCKGY